MDFNKISKKSNNIFYNIIIRVYNGNYLRKPKKKLLKQNNVLYLSKIFCEKASTRLFVSSADAEFCRARRKSYKKVPVEVGKRDLMVQPSFKKKTYYNYFPEFTLPILIKRPCRHSNKHNQLYYLSVSC